MKTLAGNKGFTLIEIMVSLAILAILIVGVGSMLTTSVRVTAYNEDRHIADKLAQDLLEKIVDFTAQGTGNFNDLIANDFQGALPNQEAIPGVRPFIAGEPTSDRIYNDFNGDGVAEWGLGAKNIYVYQLLISDIPVGGTAGFLKQVTVRIYYANQDPANPSVNIAKHSDPGGGLPRKFNSPISEMSTMIALP